MITNLEILIPKDFLKKYKFDRFDDLCRYIKAIEKRAEKGIHNLVKDKEKEDLISIYFELYKKELKELSEHASREKKSLLLDFKWALEEYKISIYAQEIKIPIKISPKRLDKKLEKIRDTL